MARFENRCSKDVTGGRDDTMCSSREQNTCEWMDVFAPNIGILWWWTRREWEWSELVGGVWALVWLPYRC